jgi:hypothetical protein
MRQLQDAKIGALLDFLEKPKVMRDTDLAEKVRALRLLAAPSCLPISRGLKGQ